jgi:serine/threonine protein kinase
MLSKEEFEQVYIFERRNPLTSYPVVYKGKKLTPDVGGTPQCSLEDYVFKIIEFRLNIEDLASASLDLLQGMTPLSIPAIAKNPNFLRFEHYYIQIKERTRIANKSKQNAMQDCFIYEIVMAFPDWGQSLEEYCPKALADKKFLNHEDFQTLLTFLLDSLAELEMVQLVHRDIKPRNIVCSFIDGKMRFGLIDFEGARPVVRDSGTGKKEWHAAEYAHPDILKAHDQEPRFEVWRKHDQFGAGMTLLQVGCQLTSQELRSMRNQIDRQTSQLNELEKNFGPEARRLVENLIHGVTSIFQLSGAPNPKKRQSDIEKDQGRELLEAVSRRLEEKNQALRKAQLEIENVTTTFDMLIA